MATQKLESQAGQNCVSLRGRVSSAPIERELPSGDVIVTLRLVVVRERSPMSSKSKQSSDWVDCVAWGGRVKRSVARWQVGDVVEVEGALRRRFFRTDARTSTRVEVEVLSGRLVERVA
jgi:single-strand DNA-binding protein